jgi:hypothetical protein
VISWPAFCFVSVWIFCVRKQTKGQDNETALVEMVDRSDGCDALRAFSDGRKDA